MSDYVAENKPLAPDFVPSEPEPEAPAAPEGEATWTGPSQEEWQQWQQANAYLAEQLQEAQKAINPQQQSQIDPFADDFQSQLDAYIAQKIQPYEDLRTEVTMGEAEEQANDILADDAARNGEFDKDVARLRAEQFYPAMQQKYGTGARAAEEALYAGAAAQREYEAEIQKRAVEQHLNQLKRLGDAPREPGVNRGTGGTTVQQHVIPEGGDEMSVVRHYGGYGR